MDPVLPWELWKEVIEILTDPCQLCDWAVVNYILELHNFIPLQLAILSSISKKINKICQDRLKFLIQYIGEHRMIPTLYKLSHKYMFTYFASGGYLSLIDEAQPLRYQWDNLQSNKVFVEATKHDYLHIVKYWHDSGFKFPVDLIGAAFQSPKCLKYLHEYGLEWDEKVCAEVAGTGSLDLLKYCHESGSQKNGDVDRSPNPFNVLETVKKQPLARPSFDTYPGAWNETTCASAAASSLECLIYAHERGCKWDGTATEAAARSGNIHSLQYLHENGCPWGEKTCEAATVPQNNLACLTYVHENGAAWSMEVGSMAVRRGSIDCLKYALENGCEMPFDGTTCLSSAGAESLECVKYAVENGIFTLQSELYNYAARVGSLEYMKYLHEKNCPVGPKICFDAIPHLNCLQYAFEVLNAPLDRNTELEKAVQLLSEECLKYLREKGVTWPDGYQKWGYSTETFAEMLAESGEKMRELKLALKYNCEIDEGVCAAAARKNDVYLLKYLHENGCPWDSATIDRAAQAQSIDCIKYAHENGCKWNSNACSSAATHQSITTLKYLCESGCPISPAIYVANMSFECLKYAHERGCEWHEKTLVHAVHIVHRSVFLRHEKEFKIEASLKILQYARERNCPWTSEVAHQAAISGNLPALKWLHENGAPWPASVCSAYNTPDCKAYIHAQDDCPNPNCSKSKLYKPSTGEEEEGDFSDLFF